MSKIQMTPAFVLFCDKRPVGKGTLEGWRGDKSGSFKDMKANKKRIYNYYGKAIDGLAGGCGSRPTIRNGGVEEEEEDEDEDEDQDVDADVDVDVDDEVDDEVEIDEDVDEDEDEDEDETFTDDEAPMAPKPKPKPKPMPKPKPKPKASDPMENERRMNGVIYTDFWQKA